MDQLLTVDNPTDLPNLCSINIQPKEVFKHFSSLDASKVAGIDAISPQVLKQCASCCFSFSPSVH